MAFTLNCVNSGDLPILAKYRSEHKQQRAGGRFMTSSHGRRIQSRRALAIMAWVSLVVIAGMLWYGQENGVIRIQAWEPAALLL